MPENLQVLCRSCNAKKSDREDWSTDTAVVGSGGSDVYVKNSATPTAGEKTFTRDELNFKRDEKFFADALKNPAGKLIVENFVAADGVEVHYLALKNYRTYRLHNFTAEKLYNENRAVKITREEFERMKKN